VTHLSTGFKTREQTNTQKEEQNQINCISSSLVSLLSIEHGLDGSRGIRLGALEGHAEGAVPDELGGNTVGARDTEENSVEVLLGEAVAVERGRNTRALARWPTFTVGVRSL
jgi:hypothetical protein